MNLGVAGLSVALLALAADPADACSLFYNDPIQGEGAPGDVTPPQLTVSDWDIGWYSSQGTCGDLADLKFTVTGSDSESPFGYTIEVVDGNLPQDVFGTELVRPGLSGTDLYYYFDYEISPVQATLHVRAVDFAGNRSEPVVIVIDAARPENPEDPQDPGYDESAGCAAGGGGGGAGFGGLLLVALALAGRRRVRA